MRPAVRLQRTMIDTAFPLGHRVPPEPLPDDDPLPDNDPTPDEDPVPNPNPVAAQAQVQRLAY